MHMWMWFGYNLGDFMFPGLDVNTRWAFAITWLVLFVVAMLFEGSKVYLARVQRDAHKRLFPYRSDERRNLLCEREPAPPDGMEPTTSRNASAGQMSRWASLRVRTLVNFHQSFVFLLHNIVGYLLMLAVMLYNVHLLFAVVLGMMLGYFLFGTSLTRLQMQCFSTRRAVICTPECDDTAENTTPPLLDSPSSSTDFYICRTRACIQPSHYFRASTSVSADGTDGTGEVPNATCYYGARECPSRVARVKKMQASAHCHHSKEHSPSVEDAQLLREEHQGCCKKKEQTATHQASSSPSEAVDCCERGGSREDSPQVTCFAAATTSSQEQIVK